MSGKRKTPHALPAEAFSADGFIIDQRKTAAVPYGIKNSDYNGCGWIAAFNLLRICGCDEGGWREVAIGMRHSTLLFGLLGTNPLTLVSFLRRRLKAFLENSGGRLKLKWGLRLSAGRPGDGNIRAGIVMYWHGRGAHFVAFHAVGDNHGDSAPANVNVNKDEDTRFRFLNAVYGSRGVVNTLPGFLKRRAKARLHFMITIEETENHTKGEESENA